MSYHAPSLGPLLLGSTFLALLPVSSHLSTLLTNTDLLGPLTLGILWCSPFLPSPAPLVPQDYLPFLSFLGYVGLLLLIFDAGLSTPLSLLLNFRNLAASILVGLTGILVPIAISLALFHGAFGFSMLTAFAAGAALCSTSLGTTVSLLSGDMKRSRVGAVLMSAALLDDVVGLVIAGVIQNLAVDEPAGTKSVQWNTVVRPVLVSIAYGLGTPLLAIAARWALRRGFAHGCANTTLITRCATTLRLTSDHANLFIITTTLIVFVATSHLAGTSELFGAYLAGAFLACTFDPTPSPLSQTTDSQSTDKTLDVHLENPILTTFHSHITSTLLQPLFSPLFFASIGASIPVNQFFTIYLPGSGALTATVRSHRVIWRGLVYSLLMILAKTITGVWVFAFWKKDDSSSSITTTVNADESHHENATYINTQARASSQIPNAVSLLPSRLPTALLLGLAMVARGEIALIVAQIARPLLVQVEGTSRSEEPFVIVMWAVLVTTFAGALGVGWVIRTMSKVARTA